MADPVEAIARAVLYEGYLLYPYTRSAVKNQVRWTFGGLHPPDWEAERSSPAPGWQGRYRKSRVSISSRSIRFMIATAKAPAGRRLPYGIS